MTKSVCATLGTSDAVTRIRVHIKECRLVVRASRAVMLVVPTSSVPIGLKAGDATLVARFLTGPARLASIARLACTGVLATRTCAALAAFFIAILTPEALTTTLVASAIAVTGALQAILATANAFGSAVIEKAWKPSAAAFDGKTCIAVAAADRELRAFRITFIRPPTVFDTLFAFTVLFFALTFFAAFAALELALGPPPLVRVLGLPSTVPVATLEAMPSPFLAARSTTLLAIR